VWAWKSILKEESLMAATGFLRWDEYQASEYDDRQQGISLNWLS
jgi:hypothetical protein